MLGNANIDVVQAWRAWYFFSRRGYIETTHSCSFRKIEKPSLYMAARVARSTSILLVGRLHAVWNAIFDDIKC